MTQDTLTANDWRPVLAVWLHDHRLLIADDVSSYSTDFPFSEDPEAQISLSPKLWEFILGVTDWAPSAGESFSIGLNWNYTAYPQGCELVAAFAQVVPEGLEIKMHVKSSADSVGWTEYCSYRGRYTAYWRTATGFE